MSPRFVSGFGASHSERIHPYSKIDLAGIRALIDEPPRVDKLQAQWIIPSTLLTRTFQEQEQDGQFWLLWADLDQNPPGLEAVAQLLQPLLCDYEIYTSRSATVETPKCRILIPLASPLPGSEWRLAQEVLNDTLQAGGAIPDRANERCGQLCFLPNRGQFYDVRSRRLGECFDPLIFWADAITKKRTAIAEAERAIKELRAQSQARKASLSPRTTPSLIDAFNQAYPVEEILLCAGYAQRGGHFRHLNSQSGSYSASVKDGRVFTHSTNDLLYTNGQGAHDAFSAFSVLFTGGDTAKALKLAGDEWLMIGDESWNAVQRREYAIAHAPEEIDVTPLLENIRNRANADDVPPLQDTPANPPTISVRASKEVKESSEPFTLKRFALNGQSAILEAQMLEDAYILGRLALLGQSTAIYAPPNAGKTLLTLALLIEGIELGEICGEQVFYINADDHSKGLLNKLKIAEKFGFHMIAPNQGSLEGHDRNIFKLDQFPAYVSRLIADQTARGVIVILDTVKKFTDIMDKRACTQFGKIMRAFVQAGGSVIMLAHVNKHRDDENKVVAAGTSDIIDDVDCAYTLDTVEHGLGEFLATFENKKSRGDVEPKVTYRYARIAGNSYDQMLATVRLVSDEEASVSRAQSTVFESLEQNRELIDILIGVMRDGLMVKGEIIKEAVKRSDFSRDAFRRVLKIHTGESFLAGYYWTMTLGEKNAQTFTLLKECENPITPIKRYPWSSGINRQIITINLQAEQTTANAASTANSISTGLLTIGNHPQTAANTANSYLQLIGEVGNDWRASP